MNYIKWAKQNKKSLVAKIVGEAKPLSDKAQPIAVFTAGVTGAGKTEFLDKLLEGVENIVRIDMDEIVKLFEDYSPDRYYEFRGAANIIVDESVIYCRHNSLDFVLDGTFGSGRAVDNVKNALKRHRVNIFYVYKDPAVAWEHTKDRQLVIKRGVDKDGFIKSCINVPNNLREVRDKFSDKVSIMLIRKDLANGEFQLTKDMGVIDNLLEVSYTNSRLKKIII